MSEIITTEEIEERLKRVSEKKGEHEQKKELRKIVVEFDEEERENCTTEIYLYKKIAWLYKEKLEISSFIELRLKELEEEFKLSKEEELVRFWIAEILFDLNIIDLLDSDMATKWLIESQEYEIKLVRKRRNG